MPEDVFTLFDEYAVRFARGERPDARGYLRRAGEGADELAELMDAFLARAEPPPAEEAAVVAARAWAAGQPPLLELRTSRGLRVEEIVERLMSALGLDPTKREKVKRYYHQLETGQLDPARVDRSVLESLASTLRARVADVLTWRSRPAAPSVAHYHAGAPPPMAAPAAAEFGPLDAPEPDEIDRLFGGR